MGTKKGCGEKASRIHSAMRVCQQRGVVRVYGCAAIAGVLLVSPLRSAPQTLSGATNTPSETRVQTKTDAKLDELVAEIDSQSPNPSLEGFRAWGELLDAGENGRWPETIAKANVFLKAPGYAEPLQREFAEVLVAVLTAKASRETEAIQAEMKTEDQAIKHDQELSKAAKEAATAAAKRLAGQFFNSVVTKLGGGNAPKPDDAAVAVLNDIAARTQHVAELEQRLHESQQKDEAAAMETRETVLNVLKALEQNQMIRPLVLLATAYQKGTPGDTEIVSYAQTYATAVRYARESSHLADAALQEARALADAGKFWSARESARVAAAKLDTRIRNETVRQLTQKEFAAFNHELDYQGAAYQSQFDRLMRMVVTLKYAEAVGLRKDFEQLARQYPDNPSLREDEATLDNAVAARFDQEVKDRLAKIEQIAAENGDFDEARKMLDGLQKEFTSDPYTVSVVKSFIEKHRRDIFDKELDAIDKRLDTVLDQVSPYGAATTTQFRAGHVSAFSTVKVLSMGRTNLLKAQVTLKGLVSQLVVLTKDESLASAAQRARWTALKNTAEAAANAVDNGLTKAKKATPWLWGFGAIAVSAVGGALFLLLLRPRRAAPA